MRPELFVNKSVLALGKKMQIKVAERGQKRICVVLSENVVARIANTKTISRNLFQVRKGDFEQSRIVRASHWQGLLPADDYFNLLGIRTEGANDDAIVEVMSAQYRMRVTVLERQEG